MSWCSPDREETEAHPRNVLVQMVYFLGIYRSVGGKTPLIVQYESLMLLLALREKQVMVIAKRLCHVIPNKYWNEAIMVRYEPALYCHP